MDDSSDSDFDYGWDYYYYDRLKEIEWWKYDDALIADAIVYDNEISLGKPLREGQFERKQHKDSRKTFSKDKNKGVIDQHNPYVRRMIHDSGGELARIVRDKMLTRKGHAKFRVNRMCKRRAVRTKRNKDEIECVIY